MLVGAILWTACLLCVVIPIESARILAIVPVPSYSHQIPYRPLWIALSQRGHEVVVLTPNPINNTSLTNLTEIDFHLHYQMLGGVDFIKKRFTHTWLDIIKGPFYELSAKLTDSIYKHPEVRKMYSSDSAKNFDVVIMELLITPGINALAYHFNAPVIGVLSLGLSAYDYYLLGNSILPSHPSSWEMENDTGFDLSFWQRMKNFIRLWHHVHFMINTHMMRQQAIVEKYLGANIPKISDMQRNISIVLHNQQDVLSFVRPKTPNIIPFGGLHLSKSLSPLPKELKEFLDDAPNGFIYVSMGTNVFPLSFPKATLNIIHDVLANLPYKILWKFHGTLPNKSDNILLSEWLPQQEVLAHPKIRLFVYQGGLQSTEEAVYYAVPLVGIPILADQDVQVNKMVSLGVAERVDIKNISRDILYTAITDVLKDNRYKENMLKIKKMAEDKPQDFLQQAIWWIEFVIRYKGAPHLRSSLVDEEWYRRNDIDIVAFLSVIIFLISFFVLLIITFILYKLFITTIARIGKEERIINADAKKKN